ncbi:MAG: Flp pilus assembly complex ATPase component TadA [Alphaproteobacteria bacterium]|nr:Flp pilus assembly complex ATPase component TadA [Alphaproteobacteria bacterium]
MSYNVLESSLRYLSYWYNQDNVEEVAVNHPGEVWLRLRGKRAHPWIVQPDENLSRDYLVDIIHIIANTYELNFDPDRGTPVVYATLPGDHRFSAIAGRNVMYDHDDLTGGVALCIRVHSDDVSFGFHDYGLEKGRKLHKLKKQISKAQKDPDDPYEKLMLSMSRGDHILISGATATGKTTFLNNLLKTIDPHMRIISVEDTRELLIPNPNRIHLVLSRTEQTNDLDYPKVIDLIVRMTPDAIIGGEISTANAGCLWELMGSGHDNCYATIHAESAEAAYKAFTDRILHTYPTIDRTKTIEEMRERLRVVQINRDGNLRAVTEIV